MHNRLQVYPERLTQTALMLLLAVVTSDAADGGRLRTPGSPALLISTVSHNGMPRNIVPRGADWNFGPGGLWTHQGWQYAAYWDDACQVSVARRQLPSGAWSVVSLPDYQRTENVNRGKGGAISQGFGDGHEKVSMGISPDGVIHLAFDHHLSTLHYRTSRGPVANDPAGCEWSAELFGPVRDNLGGPVLESVTYPKFVVHGGSLVLYLRLNGGSGSADSHFFEYADGRWHVNAPPDGKFIDKSWSGGDHTVNAYPHGLVIHEGRRHLTWCWRDTPDERTCHDLCYAYSDDQGRTWYNNDGKRIGETGKTFITADLPGVAVVTIPPGSRYRNGGSMAVDNQGRVHVLMRGENASPVHFQRDPATGRWIRKNTERLGTLIVGRGDDLFVVTEEGLYRTSASRFGRLEPVATGDAAVFEDSSMRTDPTRFDHDGWISVIGQRGKTVSVVDYRAGHPAGSAGTMLSP
jgi:hypothetical protein